MRKLTSLVLSILMVLSMLASTVVYAQEDADVLSVYNALTSEMLTTYSSLNA